MRQDSQLLPGAIEGILRYESPVQARSRVAAQALELGGQQIAAGQALRRAEAFITRPDR